MSGELATPECGPRCRPEDGWHVGHGLVIDDQLDTPCSFMDGAIENHGRASLTWDGEEWLVKGRLTAAGRRNVDPKSNA